VDNTQIVVRHEDIDITYDQEKNVWRLPLRGRERSFESLAKAKEAINRPAPEGKKSGFAPTQAWLQQGAYDGSSWCPTTITAIAEISCGTQRVWATFPGGRRKMRLSDLYLTSTANNALIEKMSELTKQIEALEDTRREMANKMERFVLPEVE